MGEGNGKPPGLATGPVSLDNGEWPFAVPSAIAAGVAHEVNNPLTYVLANLNVIGGDLAADDRPVAARHQALLAEAVEGLLRIRDVVRDLAVFSRLEPSPSVSLRAVLEATAHIVRAEIEAHAEFELAINAAPRVRGCAASLAQLLLCVFLHGGRRLALKAGPTAGRRSMSVVGRCGGTGHAEVQVTLRGYAPTGDEAEWLDIELRHSPCFARAVRAAAPLGAVVTCERLDGDGGRGCTFRVRMPAAVVQDDRVGDPVAVEAPSRLRVLVADDEPIIRQTFATLSRGHDFVGVSSGREAIAALGHQPFDAVFCDLVMQDLGGVEVYDYVRRHRPLLLAQFVVMTGGSNTRAARRFLDAVEIPVLQKPFSHRDVQGLLAGFRPALVSP